MRAIEISPEEYSILVKRPFTAFDSIGFCELNKSKIEQLKYIAFNDGKNRFATALGLLDGTLWVPFSAPYGCFSNVSENSKTIAYCEAAKALVNYAENLGARAIQIKLPPLIYSPDHLTRFSHALNQAEFIISAFDLNFHYELKDFNDKYESGLDLKARQKLRSSLKSSLTIMKVDEFDIAYSIVKENRRSKGKPLWITLDQLKQTAAHIPIDVFLVSQPNGTPVASAIIYRVSKTVALCAYWANSPGAEQLRPMNFLALKMFDYYSKLGYQIFDIGISTEGGVPNFGLCDFKQGIGCKTSQKLIFSRSI